MKICYRTLSNQTPPFEYTNFQDRKRQYEAHKNLMIVTFEPSKVEAAVQELDQTGHAKVTRLASSSKYKAHDKDKEIIVGGKKRIVLEAKDVPADPHEELDVNYYYGFARIEVLKPNQIDDTIATLIANNILISALYSMKEKFQSDPKDPAYYSPPAYFVPDRFTIQLTSTDPHFAEQTFFPEHKIEKAVGMNEVPGLYIASLPTNISGESAAEKLFNTVRKFNGNEPQFAKLKQEVTLAGPLQASFNDKLSSPIPLDSAYANQWGILNSSGTSKGCNVKGAWDKDWTALNVRRLGHTNVVVAVLDTGCDLAHADLAANIMPLPDQASYYPSSPGADESDSGSHGTNVASVIGARTYYQDNNTLGIVGVAPACRLMIVKADLNAGTSADRAAAISFVITRSNDPSNSSKRFILNLSWKFGSDADEIRNAIANAVTENILVVCAAADAVNSMTDGIDIGSWNTTDVVWPASYPNVISVGAIKKVGDKRQDSNWRASSVVFSPGDDIKAYDNNSNTVYPKHKTSMAAAFVSGIAGLAWSYNRIKNGSFNMKANVVNGGIPSLKSILTTVDGVGTPGALVALNGNAVGKGLGRIDARKAVDAVDTVTP